MLESLEATRQLVSTVIHALLIATAVIWIVVVVGWGWKQIVSQMIDEKRKMR